MKKLTFLMAALLVAMVGCQKENQVTENNGLSSDDTVYMKFSIQTLTTRSGSDNEKTDGYGSSNATPDVEVGKDHENTISSVDVVLRNANSYICATVTTPAEAEGSTNKQNWVAAFNSSQLQTDTEYQVYIYANCSAKQDIDAVSTASITDMTSDDKFWMTNAYSPLTKKFSSYSTDQNSPTDLGEHFVERAMARFDYMPKGSYTLGTGVTVSLTHAALINQSKAFYLLRRVSSDGTNKEWTVGGAETKINYVVDTDYAEKVDGYQVADATKFDYPLNTPANWNWKAITGFTDDSADNWEGTDDGTTDYDGTHDLNQYYIWQYAKENTIPGADNQVNGLSTGIVFKGKLEGDIVNTANGETIYVFENVLYGTWSQVVTAAESSSSEAFKFAVSVCNNEGTPKEAAILAKAGFTGYSAVNEGTDETPSYAYYTYYYYWNRHNDNGDNTSMTNMEFAVVRNNVYKLCVDSIAKYGHPTPGGTDPDPDPVDPTDPDESGEYYFKVTVKVLPWVVRVNHIEF